MTVERKSVAKPVSATGASYISGSMYYSIRGHKVKKSIWFFDWPKRQFQGQNFLRTWCWIKIKKRNTWIQYIFYYIIYMIKIMYLHDKNEDIFNIKLLHITLLVILIFSGNHKQPPYLYAIWRLVSVRIDANLNYQLKNMHTQTV